MGVPKRTRYVVEFEVVTQFGDVQHRGTIDFASYDKEHLDFPLRSVLSLICQPGSCCKRYVLRARAVKLWKLGPNGRRVKIPVPRHIIKQQTRLLSHRDVMEKIADLTCVCIDPSKCKAR